jgi:Concanavalin A-like lectin/glucanases superfamily
VLFGKNADLHLPIPADVQLASEPRSADPASDEQGDVNLRRTRLILGTTIAAVGLTIGTAGAAHAATQVALWNMGDTGSTMSDASGNGHTGHLTGVATGQPGISGGHGFGFFSHPSVVSVPDSSALDPGTSSFSFTVHINTTSRPSSTVGDYDVLRKGLSTSDGGSYKLEILRGGNAFCDFRGSSADGSVASSGSLADGDWHTITCSRTSSSVKLVVDGKSYSKSVKTGSIANSGSLYLGAKSGGGTDQYRGLMDRVSVSRG